MKKIFSLLFVFSALFVSKSFAQNGLENIIVEKYYVANAADSTYAANNAGGNLRVGSVTYRIYADLLPGYKFQALYGVAAHPLTISSSTSFFNEENYGGTSPNGISAANNRKGAAMLDSWFSVGASSAGKMGVLKTEDTDGSVGNANGILTNVDPSAGISILVQDGQIVSAPQAVTFVGITNTGNGDLGVFDATSSVGGSFTTSNGSVASLNGSTGPTSTNRVLIGQFTTNGILTYALNIQVGTPTGGVQNFVSSNPTGSEITIASLSGTVGAPNALPVVSFTAPTNGASFITGSAISLAANATDADGTITQVEFKVDGVSVGVDATAPYTASYTGAIGSHTLTATATDDQGGVTTATINITVSANPAPTCAITAPTNGANLITGDLVNITANATDNVSVASVQFFVDGTSIGTDATAPYAATWTAVLGSHSITAIATDNLGATTTSTAVGVTVLNNVPPSCSITAPSAGSLYTAPAAVNITATATDGDGSIASVGFYVNGSLVGTDNTSPYSFSWTSVIGNASLTVKATDDRGAITTSSAVAISIADPNALPYNVQSRVASCTETTVCIPVIAFDSVKNVIGYDVVMNYDKTKLTPTGNITVGSALINPAYVTAINSIDTTNSRITIALFLNSAAPAATKFTGVGNVFCVEFNKAVAFTSTDVTTVSVSTLQESYFNGVAGKLVQSGTYQAFRDSSYTGKLAFWSNNSPIKYNSANPNQYLATTINGNNANCNAPSTTVTNPDTLGNFSYNANNGVNININKDIPATTDMQPVINGFDALRARQVLLNDVTFIPNAYQIIAMDVNQDGVVSAGDVSQINQRAVLLIGEFRQAWNYNAAGVSNGQLSKDWSFVDTALVTTSPAFVISATYPGNDAVGFSKFKVPVLSFCSPVNATSVVGTTACPTISTMTYKGILIGDIDGNYATVNPNTAFRSSEKVTMDLSKATVENGYINVPVLISSTQDVNSLDFALQFNTSAMSFNTVVDRTNSLETLSNFNNDDQTLRFTSNSLTNYDLNAQILNVKFAVGSHEVSANDFNAVAAYINGERVAFEVANGQISGTGAIVNVYPNPATDMINVVVSEDATVQLVDVSGRQVIYQTNVLANEAASISTSSIANGVYLMKVYNGTNVSVKKVVVNK
jgi:chitodextrinase